MNGATIKNEIMLQSSDLSHIYAI